MLILKINVSKLDKEQFHKGKSGTYCDLIVFENDQPDTYGNTHVVYQGVSKEAREAGKKGAIVGNGAEKGRKAQPAAKQAPKAPPRPQADPDLDAADSDIPF
jgi:hypothetical protein